MATAITAEAYVIDDDEEGLSRKMKFAIVSVLVIIIVIVVSVVATRTDPEAPAPPSKYNDFCDDALGPLNATADVVSGSNRRASSDNVTCQAEEDGGFGVWYFLEGIGERVRASTCTGTDFDTQVLVFSGSSCDALLCIGGNDQLCGESGEQSSVGFLAEKGTLYLILVRGFRASNVGTFNLTIETLEDNDSCDNALEIKEIEKPVLGSTRNATFDDNNQDCGAAVASAPGAWYRVDGDGDIMCASVINEESIFTSQLSLFSGSDCEDLECINGVDNDGSRDISWITEVGVQYFLVVHATDSNATGDFQLNLFRPPSNDLCESAFGLLPDGSVTTGTTTNACTDSPIKCTQLSSAPGVWYLVNGTGNELFISSCESTGMALQISVYMGGCGDDLWECVDSTEKLCGDQAAVTWSSNTGVPYYIFIQAFTAGTTGDFLFTLEEVAPVR
jgi:hypothetical protein